MNNQCNYGTTAMRRPIHELEKKDQAIALGFLSQDLLPQNIERFHPWISETPRGKFPTRSTLGEDVSEQLIQEGFQSSFDEGVRQAQAQISAWSQEAVRQLMDPDGHPNSPMYGHLKLPHLN